MKDAPHITTYTSTTNGPTLALFAGIHGDEPVGLAVLSHIEQHLALQAGTIHFVRANQRALTAKKRYTEKNLNRCFVRRITDECYEEHCATVLMDLLDTCDALLDLHAYTSSDPHATPFAISETNALPFIKYCPLPFVITGIDTIEKGGADGYMSNQGKVGICIELGAKNMPEQFTDLGIEITERFLSHYGAIKKQYPTMTVPQTVLRASSIYYRKHQTFSFTTPLKTFDFIPAHTHVCTDGEGKIVTEEDSYILFPSTSNPIGVEAFLTARKLE